MQKILQTYTLNLGPNISQKDNGFRVLLRKGTGSFQNVYINGKYYIPKSFFFYFFSYFLRDSLLHYLKLMEYQHLALLNLPEPFIITTTYATPQLRVTCSPSSQLIPSESMRLIYQIQNIKVTLCLRSPSAPLGSLAKEQAIPCYQPTHQQCHIQDIKDR